MPIYNYKCDDDECEYKMEELRPILDRKRPEACPACERGFMRLALSAFARTPMKWASK